MKPADSKRQMISKAQQLTMLEVLGASLILGTCLVLIGFIMKYIEFNTKIIAAKNEAITEYDQTIRNIGVCQDADRNGRLTDQELEACVPDAVAVETVTGSLRYNVFASMSQNENLESVARKRNENSCYDKDGNRIDFNSLMSVATTDSQRQQLIQLTKICSALRVIPDALPATLNTEALMASLNQIFIVSGWEPELISPRDEAISTDVKNVSVMPVSFRVRGDGATILRVLDNVERSIREFDVTSATVEWSDSGLSLQAQANAYYLSEIVELERKKIVRASD